MLDKSQSFFEKVYALAARIPAGRVMTYGQIAVCIGDGRSARYVGYAMRAAPEARGLPCHRVLNREGEPGRGGLFGGPAVHRRLLEDEGVLFLPDGRVDLAVCLFHPED